MIEVKNVTKEYENVKALNGIKLSVRDGEFVSIIGPSGSGKTTLLNIIAGLLTPTSGEVIVNDVNIYRLNRRERAAFRRKMFGFIFQAFNLIPYLTAVENVEIPMYLNGVSPTKQKTLAKKLLEKVGLGDRLTHKPSELSIGEQQRVAIVRALANNPSVIFADEPTGNIDRKTGKELIKYLKKLNEDDGVTILLVTHDPEIANFASRKLKIVDGKIKRR
jgi:putative ABC transport system ATP-binding protein